jgi:RNA polymerase sigma-70 factor (ECF subfamily)
MSDELRNLVRQARQGDVRAFEQIFQQFQRRIYNVVYQMVGQAEDAEDLTQEVFVRAYQGLPRLQEEETFPSWLHRIALNLCRTHLKRSRRWRSLTAEDPPASDGEAGETLLDQVPDPAGTPAEQIAEKELQNVVRRAVASLPVHYREVVVLHHLEGFDLETIAAMLGCAGGTVKSRLARGRAMLKERLQDYVIGPPGPP